MGDRSKEWSQISRIEMVSYCGIWDILFVCLFFTEGTTKSLEFERYVNRIEYNCSELGCRNRILLICKRIWRFVSWKSRTWISDLCSQWWIRGSVVKGAPSLLPPVLQIYSIICASLSIWENPYSKMPWERIPWCTGKQPLSSGKDQLGRTGQIYLSIDLSIRKKTPAPPSPLGKRKNRDRFKSRKRWWWGVFHVFGPVRPSCTEFQDPLVQLHNGHSPLATGRVLIKFPGQGLLL